MEWIKKRIMAQIPIQSKDFVRKELDRLTEEITKKLEELDNRMYNLNANLSALIHIQKIKSKEEAEGFLRKINQEIGKWIREVREIKGQMEANSK